MMPKASVSSTPKGCSKPLPNPNLPVVTTEQVKNCWCRWTASARVIRQRRLQEGMIVLDLPEVELVINEEGHVVDARPEDDSFTHKIIEMFMVEANEAVSRAQLTKAGWPLHRWCCGAFTRTPTPRARKRCGNS